MPASRRHDRDHLIAAVRKQKLSHVGSHSINCRRNTEHDSTGREVTARNKMERSYVEWCEE